jgi:Thymidylate synthase
MYPDVYNNMTDAYLSNLAMVRQNGLVAPDGSLEFRKGHSFILKYPEMNTITIRDKLISNNPEYLEAFWEFVMSPDGDTSTLVKMNPNAANFATEYDGRNIAYGPRIRDQLEHVLDELEINPGSRRASIVILESRDQEIARAKREYELQKVKKDVKIEYPCTFAMQYFIRDGRLHGHTIMRSNCYVSVVLVDVYVQTRLLMLVADKLDIPLGTYQHTSINAHIPAYQLDKADLIINKYLSY